MSAPLSDAELVEAAAAILSDADGRELDRQFGFNGWVPAGTRLACVNHFRGLWAVTPAGELVVEGTK